MPEGSAGMLRVLAGGVRPVDGSPPIPAGGLRDRDTLNFGLLLDRAAHGALRSGVRVRLPHALRGDVDEKTVDALSEAADLASAEGIRRAAVVIGSRLFRVDVAARSVVDAPDAQQTAITGIDGLVRAPLATDAPEAGDPAGAMVSGPSDGPARVVRNASLARALADVGEAGA